MKVLIVDDSVVYRSKIRAALSSEPWIEIVGAVNNGKIALDLMSQTAVDLVTLDMEMPVMGGLETLRKIRESGSTVKVIVFSSSTRSGSEAAIDALVHGANDFVAKPNGENNSQDLVENSIKIEILPKIKQFLKRKEPTNLQSLKSGNPASSREGLHISKHIETFIPSVVVIASSTGGPAAHDEIFKNLKGDLRCPVLIAQHMPPVFTTSFAKRISSHQNLPCKEAIHGEVLKNEIYVAPGDYHLVLVKQGDQVVTQLTKQPPRNSVRPAADYLFESAAAIFGPKCMSFVLTGMGEDGLEGARAVKKSGGGVMIQDQESCVVFGMPGAVFKENIFDQIGSLEAIQKQISRMVFK